MVSEVLQYVVTLALGYLLVFGAGLHNRLYYPKRGRALDDLVSAMAGVGLAGIWGFWQLGLCFSVLMLWCVFVLWKLEPK